MYKIDDEFRPPGRVFMKATREKPESALVPSRGSAITTSVDERGGVRFRHDVIHEKTVEAVITDYHNGGSRHLMDRDVVDSSNALTYSVPIRDTGRSSADLQQITRNKRMSTELLGSSMETTKTSQKAPDGHRRHVTHIVRKVTTLSRAEEREQANNMIKFSNDKKTIELGYSATQALEPKRVKVACGILAHILWSTRICHISQCHSKLKVFVFWCASARTHEKKSQALLICDRRLRAITKILFVSLRPMLIMMSDTRCCE